MNVTSDDDIIGRGSSINCLSSYLASSHVGTSLIVCLSDDLLLVRLPASLPLILSITHRIHIGRSVGGSSSSEKPNEWRQMGRRKWNRIASWMDVISCDCSNYLIWYRNLLNVSTLGNGQNIYLNIGETLKEGKIPEVPLTGQNVLFGKFSE